MADLPVAKLIFTSKPLTSGKKWSVELAWPSGLAEHVQDFDSEPEADDWILRMSEHWLRKRLD